MSQIETATIVEHASPYAFELTVERLVNAITNAGMTLFATIDHAASARDVGMTMADAAVLIYGNPKGGTPIMLAAPLTALDLPLRVLVSGRDDGTVAIAFHPIASLLQQAGAPKDLASRLEPGQALLIAALVP